MIWAATYALVVPLFFGLIANWDAITHLQHVPSATTLAAWVQAIGSVLAIGAAVYLQDRQLARSRAERRQDYMELVISLMSDSHQVVGSIAETQVAIGISIRLIPLLAGQLKSRRNLLFRLDHRDATRGVVGRVLQMATDLDRMIGLLEFREGEARDFSKGRDDFSQYTESALEHLNAVKRLYDVSTECSDEGAKP